MSAGKWYLLFLMHIEGEDGLGEKYDYDEEVKIKLFASTEKDANSQACYNLTEIENFARRGDKESLKKYCSTLNQEDAITFSNFQISYQKSLDAKIPYVDAI